MILETTIDTHRLTSYVHDDAILFKVNKGTYGLPQAGLLAQQRLIAHLATHGYHETSTPCLFRRTSNGTAFTLVVYDFSIKYSSQAGADHLIRTPDFYMLSPSTGPGPHTLGLQYISTKKTAKFPLLCPVTLTKCYNVSAQFLQPFTLLLTMVPQRKHPP